jgi:hypothetical protein
LPAASAVLYLSGQLKLFHIYPVNMVNSKKETPDKIPLAAKVLNRTKMLIGEAVCV